MIDTNLIRRKLEAAEAERSHLLRQLEEEREALKLATQDVADCTDAQKVLQAAAQAVQEVAHTRIASIVTRCLTAVFGDDAYEFLIEFERKRGRTEAKLVLKRDGITLEDPMEQCGGGVVDVVSMALRIACLLSTQPRCRPLLVLDEPFKHLSKTYRPRVRNLLETLSNELGIQILMVTHSAELRCGTVIEID